MARSRWRGRIKMGEMRYHVLARMIGSALLESRCQPIPIGDPSGEEQSALYVVTNRDGYACYGGQTKPSDLSRDAAAKRIKQHSSESDKAEEWSEYWVFPLHSYVHPDDVSQLERDLNARLELRLRNRRR